MADLISYPIPIGNTNSFANVPANTNTATFTLRSTPASPDNPDTYIVTFHPTDSNNPGTLILVDGNGTTQLTMTAGGWANVILAPGTGFYFNCTAAMDQVAITNPTGATR